MIPTKALEQHIAILGKTGSGKTYAAKGAVEGILSAGGRVCIIDPTGAWHGLRSSASGKSAGFPVVIFGGAHADLPLGGAHGEALAEIIGTASTPAIIDTSLMRVGERTRFFSDFADALVRKNKGPLHLVIDEAHVFAPQGKVPDPQSGAMLHAANNLVSLGRSRGLRIILITQRPAKLHKDSLTQVETLAALRLIAPQDRKAVEEWIKDNADERKGREIIASLATLKTGQGWVWAPELGVLERVAFPKIKTFDSSRAPGDVEDGVGPVLAPIDKDAIAQRLESVAKDALANDPARLKKEIADLRRQVAATEKAGAAIDPKALEAAEARGREVGESDAAPIWFRRGVEATVNALSQRIATFDAAHFIQSEMAGWKELGAIPHTPPVAAPAPVIRRHDPPPRPARQHTNGSGAPLSKAERLIMTALAQYPQGRSKSQVAILSGYAVSGGGFNNAISSLRSKAYLAGGGDRLVATEEGVSALGHYDPLPHGDELLQHWLRQLGKAERAALEVLAGAYPGTLAKDQVADMAGYAPDGGGFNNALSRLRTLELIAGRGELQASPDLFG